MYDIIEELEEQCKTLIDRDWEVAMACIALLKTIDGEELENGK